LRTGREGAEGDQACDAERQLAASRAATCSAAGITGSQGDLVLAQALAMATVVRHSGLQKEVISLYRRALRVALEKDGGKSRINYDAVRKEFREDASSVKRSDFRTIEFMLRQGSRKVDVCAEKDVSG
ncbi:Succinate dehydrogenase assembly factor 1A, partial [Durusdinium trenchii]